MKPRVVHCKQSPYDVYVGRGAGANHIWGNPYSHLARSAAGPEFVTATRVEAVERYETWLRGQPDLVERARSELRGKVLGCWCSPRACHGHVLARVANDWPEPDLTNVVVFDIESDARETPRVHKLGVQDLVCMAYSLGDGHVSLVDADAAIDLWLEWMADDSLRFLVHAGYTDMAVMAQAAYRRREGRDCDPGEGRVYELVFAAYEKGRVIDTEIRQRLTQIAFGPNKGNAKLGTIVKNVYEVDLGDEKKIPEESQELLRAGTPWEEWPRDLFETTPWRVKYGALRDRPLHTWPTEAVEYPKGDVTWPRRIYRYQHDRWCGKPIPNEHAQTLASWDLHLLSRPGWRADKERAIRIRELYRAAHRECRRHLVTHGLIRQKTVHAGKPEERVDETANLDEVKRLIVSRLGDEVPLSKKAKEWWPEAVNLSKRVAFGDVAAARQLAGYLSKKKVAELGIDINDPFAKLAPTTVADELRKAVHFVAAARDAKTKHKAIVAEGAKVLDIVDAIDKARQGPEVFDAWLAESRSVALNASALAQKAETYIKNFLDRLATDRRVRTTYETIKDTGRVSCLAGWVLITTRDGVRPISDVQVGDQVWTHRGRWRRVVHAWTKGVQPMYDVHLSNGKVVTCTASHRVLMSDGRWATISEFLHDSFQEMGRRPSEPRAGSETISVEGDSTGRGYSEATEHNGVQCVLRDAQLHPGEGAQGAKSNPLVEVENGDEKPHARQDQGEASQLGWGVREWVRLPDDLAQRQTADGAQGSDGRSPRARRVTRPSLRASHRREREEQRARQPSADDGQGSLHDSYVTDARLQDVEVEAIYPRADLTVYDIQVDEDESYEACGIFHHNSRAINVQQMPRDSDKPADLSIRGCIQPDPGWVLLVADYSQLELCALAHILSVMVRKSTGDRTYESSLAKAINSGKDCHVMMAATLLSMSYDEAAAIRKRAEKKKEHKEPLDPIERAVLDHRQIAKAANFGFPGGQGTKTYIEYAAGYGLTLTLEQATRARNAFMMTWPEMAEYFEMMGGRCKQGNGYATVQQLYSGRIRGECYFTRGCNTLFQGLAADGAKEALHRIIRAAYRDQTSPLFGTRPSGFVHDEFLVSCRKEQSERALPELERHMVEGMRVFIPDVRIEAPGRIMSERWSK